MSSRNRHVAPIEEGGQRPTTAHSNSTTTHPLMHCLLFTTFSLDNFLRGAFGLHRLLDNYILLFSALMSIYLEVPTTHSRTLETLGGAVTSREGVLSCLVSPPMKDKYLWEVWKVKNNALHNEMPHAQCTQCAGWTRWQRLKASPASPLHEA